MKKIKMKRKAAIMIMGFIALIMAAGSVLAEPLTGVEGETQSMIIIGCALAMGIAGIGSALGLMLAGTSAVAVTGEKPELFGKCLVFQVLPMTQAVYGLLTAILLMMGAGLLGGSGTDYAAYGVRLKYCDQPYETLDGADALAIVTEWNEFREPDFDEMRRRMKAPVIFDGRNLYEPDRMQDLGFHYSGIGLRTISTPRPL